VFEDGLDKVMRGVTTIEELVRIAPPPDRLMDVPTKSGSVKNVKESKKKPAKTNAKSK
jgi:hypothetical protein